MHSLSSALKRVGMGCTNPDAVSTIDPKRRSSANAAPAGLPARASLEGESSSALRPRTHRNPAEGDSSGSSRRRSASEKSSRRQLTTNVQSTDDSSAEGSSRGKSAKRYDRSFSALLAEQLAETTGSKASLDDIGLEDIDDDLESIASESTSFESTRTSFSDSPDGLEALLEEVDEHIATWLEGIDAVEKHLNGDLTLDMHMLARRSFRPGSESSLTQEIKMGAGSADILAGMHKSVEQLHALHLTTGWPRTLASISAGTIIGSTILIVAGLNGIKHGIKDARRLKQLVDPLTTYKNFLVDLQNELRSSGSSDFAADLIAKNSQGVEARLRAAKHQLSHALFEIADSAAHAGLGVIGAAEGAAALAHAVPVVKVLGSVYASAIAGFGFITAAKSGVHLQELDKLKKAVKRKLAGDDPLREPLLEFIEHERKTRIREVGTRSLMGCAGATSAGLQIAGVAGAAPTAGASIGLLAAGIAMGGATAAAFKPVKSRQRALKAVAGVETHTPAGFLYEPEHLSRLLNKTRQEDKLEASVRTEVILGAPTIDDGAGSLKLAHRFHRMLSKVMPSAEWRYIANRMASQAHTFPVPSMRFMLESTELEREYLQSHKVPILRQELEVLMDELQHASDETSEGGSSKRDSLSELLIVKAEACRLAGARLKLLEDLELRLTEFAWLNPGTDDLKKVEVKEERDDIQIDFIIAHDMATEALSKNERARVRKKLEAQSQDGTQNTSDPLRDALRKDINTRFAKVFAHAFPKRIGYVQRGVIEIALEMFCKEDEKGSAESGGNDKPSDPSAPVAVPPTIESSGKRPAVPLETIDEDESVMDFA